MENTLEQIIKNEHDWLYSARRLMYVRRCGTIQTLRSMSVAEHSYYVALIAMEILYFMKEDPEVRDDVPSEHSVLRKALFHDIEEGIVGDIPYPVKNFRPELKQMLESAKDQICEKVFPDRVRHWNRKAKDGTCGLIVNMADYIELYLYCTEEQLAGNKNVVLWEIKNTCREIFKDEQFQWVAEHFFEEIDEYHARGGLHGSNSKIFSGGERA